MSKSRHKTLASSQGLELASSRLSAVPLVSLVGAPTPSHALAHTPALDTEGIGSAAELVAADKSCWSAGTVDAIITSLPAENLASNDIRGFAGTSVTTPDRYRASNDGNLQHVVLVVHERG